MQESDTPIRPQDSPQADVLNLDRIVGVLWQAAVESFIRAILVAIFGSLALSMVSGIWEEMVPSRPPGFEHRGDAEAIPATAPPAWEDWFGQHHFAILYAIIFALTLWFRLVRGGQATREPSAESHLGRITQHVSTNWFGLIMGNAFGAMISAIVLVYIQRFTFANLIFSWVMETMMAGLHSIAQHFFGANRTESVAAWFTWYGDNQLKFTFWFFYLSAICDDLGIPNFKSLGRWLVRKFVMRRKTCQTS